MAAAATVSGTCHSHSELEESKTKGLTKTLIVQYMGLFRVLLVEAMLYVLYGLAAQFVRGGPLLKLCKKMGICTLVTDFPVNQNETSQTTEQLFYNHAFLQFDYYFAIGWPCIVLTLYFGIISLYYKIGHPKRMLISSGCKQIPEPKDSKQASKLILNEQKYNDTSAISHEDIASVL